MKKLTTLMFALASVLVALACGSSDPDVDGTQRQFAVSEIESVTFSEEKTDMEQLRQEIEQFLDEWNEAIIAADTTRLGTMMDDSIILRHITAYPPPTLRYRLDIAMI